MVIAMAAGIRLQHPAVFRQQPFVRLHSPIGNYRMFQPKIDRRIQPKFTQIVFRHLLQGVQVIEFDGESAQSKSAILGHSLQYVLQTDHRGSYMVGPFNPWIGNKTVAFLPWLWAKTTAATFCSRSKTSISVVAESGKLESRRFTDARCSMKNT